jgi:hypothetical protein
METAVGFSAAARVQGADPVLPERKNPDDPDTHARENKIPEGYFFSLSHFPRFAPTRAYQDYQGRRMNGSEAAALS